MTKLKYPSPPGWIDKILEWRLPEEIFEEVQGDLHELFHQWREESGEGKAKWLYVLNALTYFRPLPKRSTFNQKTYLYPKNNIINMNANFFKFAFRNLLKSKAHSVINIAGLALGIACCILIFLVVRFELSFDKFHSKADRIYRINTKFITTGGFTGGAPMPISDAMEEDFPEVDHATTTVLFNDVLIKIDEEVFKQNGIVFTAPDYFSIFDAHWLAGNPKGSLSEPNSVVLTESVAKKYFGSTSEDLIQESLGKTITVNSDFLLKVTGIVEDFPPNTDLPFKAFISWSTFKILNPDWDLTSWINISGNVNHFILLQEGSDPVALAEKMPAFEKKYMGELEASRRTHLLQSLKEMHFDSRFSNYNRRTMDKTNINGLILIGVFILMIACINFINLATAQSVKKSKQVGVQKVLGASRSQLIKQFLAETGILSLLSMFLAIGLCFVLVPQIKALLDLNFDFNPLSDISLTIFLISVTFIVSIIAGFYPAFYLSGSNPVLALKNKILSKTNRTFSLRRILIVVQFAIAQVLIICTIIISSQLEYFRNKPLGFNKEAIITIPFPPGNVPEKWRPLRSQLEQTPGIESLSFAIYEPSSESSWWSTITFQGSDPDKEYYVQRIPIDHTYLETFGLNLIAGKNLGLNVDSSKVIVNETMVKQIGIPSPVEAVGTTFSMGDKTYEIEGVVKDFHTGHLRGGIGGVVMGKDPFVNIAGIKLEPDKLRSTIAQIEQLWKNTYPESVFEFEFLDETIAGFYKEEVKMYKLFRAFSGIAIFISCLGLYGLVSFMAVQRTKEIGIRKVLGASLSSIVSIFSKEFFILITIAFTLAAPLAWYAMNGWLKDFENKLPICLNSFLVAIAFSLFIGGITVIYRSLWAALMNPVKSLRSE